jgi:2-polyprenyl-3-methyl-5-hydroxy-6-metoxy-1,4-benzoquinol methylase
MRTMMERLREPELMDDESLDERDHIEALKGLSNIHRYTNTIGLLWPPIFRLALRTSPEPLRILDLATGGGDLPLILWRRANRLGIAVDIAGCDLSPVAVNFATERAVQKGANVRFFQLDLLKDPLPLDYDVIMCSLFLHHLDEDNSRLVLRKMKESTKQMVLLQDLVRSQFALIATAYGTKLFSRSHVVHYDGPASVRAAYTLAELSTLCQQAGLDNCEVTAHWPFRMRLIWNKR